MKYNVIIDSLNKYVGPEHHPSVLFLPEDAIHLIYDRIIENKLYSCIELGTAYGATACVIAGALEEIGGGQVITVDHMIHETNIYDLIKHTGISKNLIEFVNEKLGYNWYLADLIQKQTDSSGYCNPLFDFCLIDGSHQWVHDALAFTLISKLLKPGGWIALDDMDWNFRMFPNVKESMYAHFSERELDTFQMKMVYDLLIKQHKDYFNFHITNNGRVGWAQKKTQQRNKTSIFSKILNKFII